jgi:hypothetical protein
MSAKYLFQNTYARTWHVKPSIKKRFAPKYSKQTRYVSSPSREKPHGITGPFP